MKVYVVSFSWCEHYDAGDSDVRGVFSSFDAAFSEVRTKIPGAKRRKTNGEWSWEFETRTYYDSRYSIEAFELQ